MSYLLLYLVSIVSPVLALAEPLCLLSALSSPDAWLLIALVVAAGQTTGFALLYFFGDRLLKWMPKVRTKLESFDISDYKLGAHSIIVCGAIFGLPPATLLATAGRVLESRVMCFLGILFTGRLLRFCVVSSLPHLFSGIFRPEQLPQWVQGLF
jgi:membrane protein YqaA with SNARE-associated domain